ncbi:MAG TPA: tetratricopeptide repeat protein [Casimicrobiaceae bacterium]|nr:tetratricopeptide repeat protein [Casimicrobiaceae bacterium]
MTSDVPAAVERFEQLLAAGKDSALLRFGLGSEYLKAGDGARAALHLRRAVAFDPGYSAAWKLLGRALAAQERYDEALAAYNDGIAAAGRKGDKQAMKEMQVFAKRIAREHPPA